MMRLESEIKLTVRGRVIGGPEMLVCLPLSSGDRDDLIVEAAELKGLEPDLFEWRVDGYGNVEDPADCLGALAEIRDLINDIPLIFTCRIDREGGFRSLSRDYRLSLITAAIESGMTDLVDIEMCNDPDFIENIKSKAREHKTALILSYHNFKETPDEASMVEILTKGQEMGADISKMAVMPGGPGDALKLMNATLKARTESVRIPMVTMAMAEAGAVTRVAGGLFGSDISFALGKGGTAPGQIPIDALRNAMKAVY